MVLNVNGNSDALNSILQLYGGLTEQDLLLMAQIKMGQIQLDTLKQCQTTLDVAISDFLKTKEGKRETTQKGYAQDLKQFKEFMLQKCTDKGLTQCYVDTITKGDIDIFLNTLVPRRKDGNGKIKANARNRKLAVIRGLFNYLVDEKILRKSPASSIDWANKGTLPIMFLTKEQQSMVLRTALKNRENGLRDFTIIFLALNLGLRLSEICNLSIGDICLEKEKIEINGKGGKKRTGIFHYHMLEHVENYLRYVQYPSVSPEADEFGIPLFCNKKGKNKLTRISQNSIEKTVCRVFRKCSIEEGSVHRLRHTFAINCLDSGINIVHIMHLLGHENITTTILYLRLSEDLVLKQVRDNFPLAYVSIDNFSEFINGQVGIKLRKSIEVVKNDDNK